MSRQGRTVPTVRRAIASSMSAGSRGGRDPSRGRCGWLLSFGQDTSDCARFAATARGPGAAIAQGWAMWASMMFPR
jgi:hypothetical protein